jgi:GT2 family glycosyltransferase
MTQQPLLVIVPFYKNVELVDSLIESLERCAPELQSLNATVLCVNDSPDDQELLHALTLAAERLRRVIPCTLEINSENLGFVKSCNLGLRSAVDSGANVLLLNSDTEVFPGAIEEMAQVLLLDPMIGFVNPRSNNATICTFPTESPGNVTAVQAHLAWKELKDYLPRFQFAPTAVGFCMLIRWEILAEFGLFDEAYARGYNEENDLVMRANRCGYRAVLANQAFVYHKGEVSFSLTDTPRHVSETRNQEILLKRYPEYLLSVDRYFRSPRYESESLISAMLPDSNGQLRLAFDLASMECKHCGSFELARRLVAVAASEWVKEFSVFIICDEKVARYHQFHELQGISRVPIDTAEKFAIVIRPYTPFSATDITRVTSLGAINLYVLLDTIALDCQYLDTDLFRDVLSFLMRQADGIAYISETVQKQFQRRFSRRPDLLEKAALLSMDLHEYSESPPSSLPGKHILIVGNHYEHKHVVATLSALAPALPQHRIVALGVEDTVHPNVVGYRSGLLSESVVAQLYQDATIVIYPSHYEGFGLPLLTSLAYQRPIFVRRLEVFEELIARLGDYSSNVYFFHTTSELVGNLGSGLPSWKPVEAQRNRGDGWNRFGQDVLGLVKMSLQKFSPENVLLPRLEAIRQFEDKRAEAELAAVKNSLSWRITGPIRSIADKLRG